MTSLNTTSIDYRYASEQSLKDACKSGAYPVIGGCEFGRLVVQISDDTVIKYGFGVTIAEARTQAYVHEHVDTSVFRVPEVYRFFEDESDWGLIGYLVMKFIDGTTLDALDEKLQTVLSVRLAGCLRHLWQISVPEKGRPGPVGGGEPRGNIWSDDSACTVFETLSDMEEWLNVSLENDEDLAKLGRWDTPGFCDPLDSIGERLSLADFPLVICHGDIAGRNAVLQKDGILCIIDWGCAGFYPFFFDLYQVMSNESRDPALLTPLLDRLVDLRTAYAKELHLLRRVQRANATISRLP